MNSIDEGCHWVTDSLTGLLNQGQLRHLRPDSKVAIIDIAAFRLVNDEFGHVVGDKVLRTIAGRLRDELAPRRVYRAGGDEFAVELEADVDFEAASRLAERIIALLAAPIPEIPGWEIHVRIGFGPEPVGENWEQAWIAADKAVAIAGRAGAQYAFGDQTGPWPPLVERGER